MIRKLKCWIWGHQWSFTFHYNPPSSSDRQLLMFPSDYHERYGFTDILRTCQKCGVSYPTRVVGDVKPTNTPDSEISQLRKMAGL